jgi:hypothetical protein
VGAEKVGFPIQLPTNKIIGKESLVISKKTAVAVAATFGMALSCISMVPAQADPVSNSYAIVGSDTLEDVVAAIVHGTSVTGSSVRLTSGGNSLGSFDATGSLNIITKPYGPKFARPNGSGDGTKALSRSMDGLPWTTANTPGSVTAVTITGQVDIARSSAGATENATGALLYVPFGRDALGYAYGAADGATPMAAGLDSMTKAQLLDFYSCAGATTAGSRVSLAGSQVMPIIPQAGSGTYKDFLAKVGITAARAQTSVDIGCAKFGQEHDASTLATNEFTIMSASRWVAMSNGASVKKQSALANMAGVATTAGTAVAAVDGVAGALSPNVAYYADATWGRDTFIVVEYARVASSADSTYDANLANAISSTNSKSLGYVGPSALGSTSFAVKKKFGFLAPSVTVPYRVAKS